MTKRRRTSKDKLSPQALAFLREGATPRTLLTGTEEASASSAPERGSPVIGKTRKRGVPPPASASPASGPPKPVPHSSASRKSESEAPAFPPTAREILAFASFRLPQPLLHQLERISSERKIAGLHPYAKQDIVAEALRQWLSSKADPAD